MHLIKYSWKYFSLSFRHNWRALGFLALSIVLHILMIGGAYKINSVYGELYSAIQEYKVNNIWGSVFKFSEIAFLLVLISGYSGWIDNRLGFEIRKGLNAYFVKNLNKLINRANLSQLIQEDIRNFGDRSVSFWTAIFTAVVKLPLFLNVLGQLTHWYMAAFIFVAVILGTLLINKVSSSLVALQSTQEDYEAGYRQDLDKAYQSGNNFINFDKMQFNFIALNKKYKLFAFTQSGISQAFVLLPFIILLPLYISKAINLGGFLQSDHALAKVIDSLTILIDKRQTIVDIKTTLRRLNQLEIRGEKS